MTTLLQDLRYAVRMLLKSPGFTAVALLTLAIGIGANTAIFTLINSVLIRPLPVGDPQGLVLVGDPSRGATGVSIGSPQPGIFSYPEFKLFRDYTRDVFSDLYAAGRSSRVDITMEDGSRNGDAADGNAVTGNYFAVLQAKPVLGRTFTAADDAAPGSAPVVVLSYGAWKRRFNLDPAIVGRTLRLNGYPFTVIGVMGPEFFGDVVARRTEMWVPMCMEEQLMPGRKWLDNGRVSWLHVMGRLKPGVTLAHAKAATFAAMAEIAKSQWATQFDKEELRNFTSGVNVQSGAKGFSGVREQLGTPLVILMGIVGLVLLIACVNVASLLLARASARAREVAVRLAIGASPGRIVRQLLTESLLLSLLGGVGGLLFANWGTAALVEFVYKGPEPRISVSPDWRVLAFTFGVCVLTGILFGLAPALQSTRLDLSRTLKEGARTTGGGARWSLGRVLVSGEVALSVLVIFASGLLIHSLRKLEDVDLGYNRDHVIVAEIDPLPAGYTTIEKSREITDRLQQALSALPGVTAATGSENGLFSGTESADSIKVPGFTAANPRDTVSWEDSIGPNYFSALQIPILLGREITPADTATSPRVAVVNEAMMKYYFHGENPIGRTFVLDDDKQRDKPFTVIGVVRNVHTDDVREQLDRRFYTAVQQSWEPKDVWHVEVRTLADPKAMTESIRQAIHGVDKNLQIVQVDTIAGLVDDSLLPQRIVSHLSTFFGAIVLLLASVGLYGIMAYTVAGRTREIGVRMALGAQRGDVLAMVLREALTLVVVGAVVGIPAAIAASRAMGTLLFGLHAVDPLALAATVVLLAVVAGIAGFLPARRAAKVDPMSALRYE